MVVNLGRDVGPGLGGPSGKVWGYSEVGNMWQCGAFQFQANSAL